MDSVTREILSTLVEHIQHLLKTRNESLASIRALAEAVCANSSIIEKDYRQRKDRYLQELSSPRHDVDVLYNGLLELLKNPGPPVEDEQEKIRRLLESFEGPKQ
jgi:hypothetical protein